MKYQLFINQEQAKILSIALDFYSRISGGQFDEILCKFHWERLEIKNQLIASELFTDLKCMLTGLKRNQLNMGIGNTCNNGKIAYDLHQVIRYRLANDDPDTYKYSVDFSPPMKYGSEPLAKIEVSMNDKDG